MIPQDAPHEDAQPAKEATRDTETPADTEGGREDLRATMARVRDLAEAAERTGCGAGWTLDPAEVLAALDRGDLPAVREFADGFDPRGEPPCPTT